MLQMLLSSPDHVGQIDPGIGVLDWGKSAILPDKGTILLEETLERAAAGATVQPDGDLVARQWIVRGEEPEVQFARLVRSRGDGQKAGIGFTNIEVDVRDRRAIDGEFLRTALVCVSLQINHRSSITLGVVIEIGRLSLLLETLGIIRVELVRRLPRLQFGRRAGVVLLPYMTRAPSCHETQGGEKAQAGRDTHDEEKWVR